MNNMSFKKKFRLLKNKDFFFVLKSKLKVQKKYISILYSLNKLKHPRLGIFIKKKYVKKSCNRNKIKRIIRESFRKKKNYFFNIDFLILINAEIIKIKNEYIRKILNILWKKILNFKKNNKNFY